MSHESVPVPEPYLSRARAVCLSLPEATEKETWGHPTFRVRDKIFAGIGVGTGVDPDAGTGEPRVNMSMKADRDEQPLLLARGAPFFKPRYVGSKGWIGIYVDDETDWDEVAELVEDSYRLIAPKKLVRKLGEP